jgi:outer membrane murein-binding lipoprotein Lpp
MRTIRNLAVASVLAVTSAGLGCVQSGPIQNHRTTLGTLKTSVSQLEFEKEQLRKEVADLKSENRRVEDRLTQEEAANGELTAKLDDARVILRGRGLDTDSLVGPSRSSDDPFDDPANPPTSRPARAGRKPPFARIPGRSDQAPSVEDGKDDPFYAPSTRPAGTFGPQSRVNGQSPWMPVARGADAYGASVR